MGGVSFVWPVNAWVPIAGKVRCESRGKLTGVEINADHANENKRRLPVHCLLQELTAITVT